MKNILPSNSGSWNDDDEDPRLQIARRLSEPLRTEKLLELFSIQFREGLNEDTRDTAKSLPEPVRTEKLIELFDKQNSTGRDPHAARDTAKLLLEPLRTERLEALLQESVREGMIEFAQNTAKILGRDLSYDEMKNLIEAEIENIEIRREIRRSNIRRANLKSW